MTAHDGRAAGAQGTATAAAGPPRGAASGARAGPDLDAAAPPYDYNPSAWSQRVPVCILAMIAFGIAGYMALYQWRLVDDVWDPLFGAQSAHVLDSGVAERMRSWFGVPDAAFGAIAYLGDAIFGLAGSTRRWQYRPWLVILFGLDVIPLGIVSIVLVVLQGVAVGSWCFLCLVTAAISMILIWLAYDEVWASLCYLRRVHAAAGARAAWGAFLGRASPAAARVALVRGGA